MTISTMVPPRRKTVLSWDEAGSDDPLQMASVLKFARRAHYFKMAYFAFILFEGD